MIIRANYQALGLRHEDIKPEDNQVRIVPRDNNANGARAKTRSAYLVPGLPPSLMELYTDYLISDLSALEADHLPDYVFINLWEGERGRPMTYAAVRSLFRRLQKRTGFCVTPHMFRHTRATKWIKDEHLSLPTTSRVLGHKSIETTNKTYLAYTDKDLRAAMGKSGEKEWSHGV